MSSQVPTDERHDPAVNRHLQRRSGRTNTISRTSVVRARHRQGNGTASNRGRWTPPIVDARQVAVVASPTVMTSGLAVAADSCCRDTAVARSRDPLWGPNRARSAGTTTNPDASPARPPRRRRHRHVDPGPARAGIAGVVVAFRDAYLKHRPDALHRPRRAAKLTGGLRLTSVLNIPTAGTPCPGAP